MNALAQRQRRFMAAVRGEAPAEGGLQLYREQALAGWHQALAAAYPVVHRLVGPTFFREVCDRYADAHPSTGGDLHAYGAHLPRFIAAYTPARSLRYLGDMARLEWALHEAAFAADAAAFDFASLAGVPDEAHGRIVPVAHPAARAIESPWPLEAWWRANQPDRDGSPDAEATAGRGVLAARGEGWPEPHRLDDVEWRVFAGCVAERSLDAITQSLGDEAAHLPAAIARLARCNAFRGFRLS